MNFIYIVYGLNRLLHKSFTKEWQPFLTYKLAFAVLFFVLFVGISSAQAQEQSVTAETGSLTGQIVDEYGYPVSFASVRLDGNSGTQSDSNGNFSFSDIRIGRHEVSVTSVGFRRTDKTIEVLADSTSQLQIVLSKDVELKEVVVTAGRKPESIDEVPSSISILTAREVQAQSVVNPSIASVLGNTIPGLGTATNKATNSGQTLRGRQVLVLIDGIPQSTPLMNGSRDIRTIDPAVIERVEVIKGATSIYGNGSGGGIINFITKKPAAGKRISGTTSIGSNGNVVNTANTVGYRISQLLAGTVNKFTYVVNGTYNYTGVFKDAKGEVNGQDDGLGETSLYNLYLKAGYKPNEHSQLLLTYNLFSSVQRSDYINSVGVYGEHPSIGIKGDSPGEPAGTPQNHNLWASYSHDGLPFETALDVTAYYNRFISMNRYVPSATAWYGPGQTQIQSFKKGIRLNLNTPWSAGSISGEVTYGLDLLNDMTNQVLTDGRVYIPDMNMVNLAPYAQLKVDLVDQLVFKGGVRYENARVKVKDFRTIATGPDGAGSIDVTGGTIPYNATMFNAGLRYSKYEFFNPFISFSQGFAINELGRILRRAKESTLQNLETDPIITNNYEAGFSSRFGIMSVTAAYYISTSNLGLNLVDVGGFLMPQREPEKVYGYEATAEAYVHPKVTLGASYSYVEGKAELDDDSEIYLNGGRIAPPKGTAYVYYRPTSNLNFQLYLIHTGSRDRFDVRANGLYGNSEGPVKSVNLINLSGSYRINSKWTAGLGVENLLNTSYYPVTSQYRAVDAEYVQGNGAKLSLNLSFDF